MGKSSVSCDGIPSRGWVFEEGQDHLPSDSANADIAGIGIAIGFSAAAYITFVIVVVYYLLGYVGAPFSNTVDHRCLRFFWKRASKRPKKTWEPFLRKAVLIYSDTQLVMGLAILGSLYPQLVSMLPSYYWQIGVYLAWFSSHTHLTSITILRQFLRDHPAIRIWRVVMMVIMVILLAIALLPTGDTYWIVDDQGHFLGGVPAICHFYRLRDASDFTVLQTQGFTMLISFLILSFGYTIRILKLSTRTTDFTRKWLRVKPGNALRSRLDKVHIRLLQSKASQWWIVPYMGLEICLVLSRASLDSWESMLWEILWLFMALVWGSLHLFLARTKNLWKIRWQTAVYEHIPHHEDDNDWSFAQVFEVIILFLPILHTGEAFFEHRREVKLGFHSHLEDEDLHRRAPDNRQPNASTVDVEHGQTTATHDEKKEPTMQAISTAGPTPSATSSSPVPLPLASHEQDYYELVSFRLLIALIILFSLGDIFYAIALSLKLDIGGVYFGVLSSIALTIVECIVWTAVMVTWSHCRPWVWRRFGIKTEAAEERAQRVELAFAWGFFCVDLAACGVFMATYGPLPYGKV